jgi:transposase
MYKISREEAQRVREAMKKEKNVLTYRRMEAVALRGEGKKNGEIAMVTGFHSDMVSKYARIYLSKGIEGLRDGRKGGNNRNASETEEREFMAQLEEAARKGQIITINEIAAAYDERFGKEHKSKSTVYYLLKKLKWRKVMPRSKHPNKASEEEIESSKKLKIE